MPILLFIFNKNCGGKRIFYLINKVMLLHVEKKKLASAGNLGKNVEKGIKNYFAKSRH